MANQISNDKGIFRLYDGTIVYIEEILYSADGQTNFEVSFNPNEHLNTITGVGTLAGHKYRKVRHAGDTKWQIPEYIVAENGKNIELQTTDEYLQWRVVGSTTWTNLILLDSIRGNNGIQGIPGSGITIDRTGAFDTKPSCSTTTGTTGTTLGCGCTGVSSIGASGLTTFLSLGNHILNDTDDTGTYWANEGDLPTFKAYVSATDKGLTAKYWHASATIGTGAYTYLGINLAQGLSGGTDTTGKLYTCINGSYIEILSIAANDHRIAETSGSTNIGYLDNFVTDYGNANITGIGTIGIDGGKLEIIDESITTDKFDTTIFNDGLTNTGTEIDVNASELIGYGLKVYTSASDSYNNIQVYVRDIISDGLTYESDNTFDGETRDKIIVHVDDIVSPTTGTDFTGLETSADRGITETDGYENIYVKEGDCISTDVNGVNVVADELSLTANNLTAIKVKPYTTGNDGICAIHLNPTVVNTNKGIDVDNSTGLEVIVDASTIGFNASGGLEIPDNGVTGNKLNDNTCNNLAGVEVLNDTINVKVDDITIEFNGSGELTVKDLANSVVTGITDSDTSPILAGQVNMFGTIAGNGVNCITVQVIANATGNKITTSATIDQAKFDTFITGLGYLKSASNASATWGDITGNISAQSDLQTALNSKVDENTSYDNIIISNGGTISGESTIEGIYIKLGSTSYGAKLMADDNGNLYVDTPNKKKIF